MSNSGKKYFAESFKNTFWKGFIKELKGANSEKEVLDVLNRVLSPQERINMEKRLAILRLISDGASYRKISEIVDTHYSTISFVKRGFKRVKRKPKKYSTEEKSRISDIFKRSDDTFFRPYRFIPKTSKRKRGYRSN